MNVKWTWCAAVGAAGAAGALLRYAFETSVFIGRYPVFPWGTFAANAIGCLVLGWFSARFGGGGRFPAWLRIAVTTGFLGSFTTFSSLVMEAVSMVQQKRGMEALGYWALSLFSGLFLAWAGKKAAKIRVVDRRKEEAV